MKGERILQSSLISQIKDCQITFFSGMPSTTGPYGKCHTPQVTNTPRHHNPGSDTLPRQLPRPLPFHYKQLGQDGCVFLPLRSAEGARQQHCPGAQGLRPCLLRSVCTSSSLSQCERCTRVRQCSASGEHPQVSHLMAGRRELVLTDLPMCHRPLVVSLCLAHQFLPGCRGM